MVNVRIHRCLEFVPTEGRTRYTVFHWTSINRNEKKTEIPKNQPAYLQLSILQLSKILLHQFWCDYEKPIYREKSRLYYLDICFIVSIKTDDIYKDIAEDFESGKVIGLMESELGRNIMIKFVELRAKNYSYLIDDDIVKIKKKKTQKCVS